MKQFIKSLPKDGEYFRYLCSKFPKVSEAKLKEGVFTVETYENCYPITLQKQWRTKKNKRGTLKDVVHRFLGNTKDPLYETIAQRMLTAYEAQSCKMSLKVHFLHSHIDCIPENLGAYNEEQGERFYQDVRDIERRYQGRWDVNMAT
ncbi:hypothetical protein AVEN_39468-1 [Araneus ventricosus]|uniref:Uncharacterized protein n=1 Tax=Araneus ventricosus TaxID=182803 RepID=A0A4Y2D818_ARAVE|nr:hypothetical protein AVEN_39468-1 [Araneus ventricosus]